MAASPPADKLTTLVQSLPRELFDEICDLTFTNSTNVTTIDQYLRLPSNLQVNRTTRKLLRPAYYATHFECRDPFLLSKWVGRLTSNPTADFPNIWLVVPNRRVWESDVGFHRRLRLYRSTIERSLEQFRSFVELQYHRPPRDLEEGTLCRIRLSVISTRCEC